MSDDSMREMFGLDPDITFLNHGSFGACPNVVFDQCEATRHEIERNPVKALQRDFEARMETSRTAVGDFVGADADEVLLVPNATYGVNQIAGSVDLNPGDEILATGDEYGAVQYTWERQCERTGAVYRNVAIPRSIGSHSEFVESFWKEVTPRTRVLVVSHITSATALRLPVEAICKRAREAGILTVIDGAHGVGHIPLNLHAMQADFYVSNCHKWLCAPRGTAFLFARRRCHEMLEPLVVSWGWREHEDFIGQNQWPGTIDFAPYWCLPASISLQQTPRWREHTARCRRLAIETRNSLSEVLQTSPITANAESWIDQMVAIPLPREFDESLQTHLFDEFAIEIPVTKVVDRSGEVERFLRVSLQVYNTKADIDRLEQAVATVMKNR